MLLQVRVQRGLYCLYCYAPLPDTRARSTRCPACERVILRTDRYRYWTRARLPRLVETICKLGAFVATIYLQMGVFGLPTVGRGHGPLLALPLATGGLLWETANRVTRRVSYVDPTFLWSGMAFLVGAAGLLDTVLLLLETPYTLFGSGSALNRLGWSVVGFSLSLAITYLKHLRRRWIGSRIRKRATRLAAAAGPSGRAI